MPFNHQCNVNLKTGKELRFEDGFDVENLPRPQKTCWWHFGAKAVTIDFEDECDQPVASCTLDNATRRGLMKKEFLLPVAGGLKMRSIRRPPPAESSASCSCCPPLCCRS